MEFPQRGAFAQALIDVRCTTSQAELRGIYEVTLRPFRMFQAYLARTRMIDISIDGKP